MSDCVTLITGASSGIGAAIAQKIAAPGQTLFLHARGGHKVESLDSVAQTAREQGAEVDTILFDLSEKNAGTHIVNRVIARCQRLDRIVSNAGFAVHAPVGEVTRQALDQSHQVMTGAFFDMVSVALPALKKSTCGRIVITSSFVVDQMPGERLFPVTAAAKGALDSLARTLAVQLARDGITVNSVAPGFTQKDSSGHSALSQESWAQAAALTPNRRLATPADIAVAVAFFLSQEARHITGQTLRVDGGLSLI